MNFGSGFWRRNSKIGAIHSHPGVGYFVTKKTASRFWKALFIFCGEVWWKLAFSKGSLDCSNRVRNPAGKSNIWRRTLSKTQWSAEINMVRPHSFVWGSYSMLQHHQEFHGISQSQDVGVFQMLHTAMDGIHEPQNLAELWIPEHDPGDFFSPVSDFQTIEGFKWI